MTAIMPPSWGGNQPTPQQLIDFTEYFLDNRKLTEGTKGDYRRDVHAWLIWNDLHGLDPIAAKFTHVNTYARELEAIYAPATVARKLCGMSEWYKFLVKIEFIRVNPVEHADRPSVDSDETEAYSLTEEETDALLLKAAAHSARSEAVYTTMADLALRVTPTINLMVKSLAYVRGEWELTVVGKRGRITVEPLPPATAEPLFRYLEERAKAEGLSSWRELDPESPLFVTRTGKPLDRIAVWRLIKKLAKEAGIENWELVGPHSLKHGFVTNSREAGVPLEDVQDGAHHRKYDTTRAYDTRRRKRERHPAWTLTARRVARRAASDAV